MDEILGTGKQLAFLNRTIHKACDKTNVLFAVVREVIAVFIPYLLSFKT
jgi:hypothetical protein